MSAPAVRMPSMTQPPDPALAEFLKNVRPGQRIKITQMVRVGQQTWPATVTGTFRHLHYLATGLTTERAADEEIVVATVHFTKDNRELSSITLDEHTRIELAS